MIQANADIERAAENAASTLVNGSVAGGLSYPPNAGFTSDELAALEAIRRIPDIESALRKVIADAASEPVFHLLTYIDGVADPRDVSWSGVALVDLLTVDVNADRPSVHDELYARYWDWRRARPNKGWRLDNLPS